MPNVTMKQYQIWLTLKNKHAIRLGNMVPWSNTTTPEEQAEAALHKAAEAAVKNAMGAAQGDGVLTGSYNISTKTASIVVDVPVQDLKP